MTVLKYNTHGEPLYWFDDETMKVWRRVDKNTSEIVNTPKMFENKVLKLRTQILNAKHC